MYRQSPVVDCWHWSTKMKPGSRCRHKAVLKLEVPVDDSLGVEELQGGGDVRNDHGSLLLSE